MRQHPPWSVLIVGPCLQVPALTSPRDGLQQQAEITLSSPSHLITETKTNETPGWLPKLAIPRVGKAWEGRREEESAGEGKGGRRQRGRGEERRKERGREQGRREQEGETAGEERGGREERKER